MTVMAKLLLHLLPCRVGSSIDINGKTLVPQVGIVRDDNERKITRELGVLTSAALSRNVSRSAAFFASIVKRAFGSA
jgi:hypothetical protein